MESKLILVDALVYNCFEGLPNRAYSVFERKYGCVWVGVLMCECRCVCVCVCLSVKVDVYVFICACMYL